jgi:hypothetical protein
MIDKRIGTWRLRSTKAVGDGDNAGRCMRDAAEEKT